MKEILNKKVIHKIFGCGIVTEVEDEDKITINFEKSSEIKKFQYPDVFEEFLKFEDEQLQESSLKLIQEKREKIAFEKEENRINRIMEIEEEKKEKLELKKKQLKEAKAEKAAKTTKVEKIKKVSKVKKTLEKE